jgi:drug/metabolite transporter (DMT)-like permease
MSTPTGRTAVGARVWLALGIVYVVWGSTYLAIRVGVAPTTGRGIPPLLLAGVRFAVAGLLMLAIGGRQRAGAPPDPIGWRQLLATAVVGCALPFGGNGIVSIAERHITSGTAALLIATVPLRTAVIAAALGRERFTARQAAGLAIGLAGIAVLSLGSTGGGDLVGVGIALLAAVSWSAGSVYAATAPLPKRPLVTTGLELFLGGVACLVVSAATGEWSGFAAAAVPARSWWALVYLIVAGAMIAYTAYAWLLSNAPLSLTTTYAYVNPVVAVVLGALILGEPFTVRTAIAVLLVVAGVVLVLARRRPDDDRDDGAMDAMNDATPAVAPSGRPA